MWTTRLFDLPTPEALFRSLEGAPESSETPWPAVNVTDDGERFIVCAEVPGLERDALDVEVRGETLFLRGRRQVDRDGVAWLQQERVGGAFERTLALPQPVSADRITATYKHGVLEVVLPRAPEAKPRRIEIH